MKRFLTVLMLAFSLSSFAQSPADLAKLAENMKLDKGQVSNMIDMMVKMGKISKDDAKKAKEELGKYSDEDMQALQHQAVQKIKDKKANSGSSLGNLMPTSGQQLSAPVINQKSPASTDAGSASKTKAPESKLNDPGYKEALDYLNQ